MDSARIARLEEQRQGLGCAEISAEAQPIAGGWMCYSGPDHWSNQAAGLGFEGPVLAADFDTLIGFFREHKATPRIEVASHAHPSLLEGLFQRGFGLLEFEEVLALEPQGQGATRARGPSELELVRVDPQDAAQVQTFLEVSTAGFREPGEPPDPLNWEVLGRMVRHGRCDSYMALIDGQPVGGGSMETTPEVACLFGASVAPEARRRGIQQALMQRRVERATELGCPLVCIHSDPGIATKRNAERLGFQLAYTKGTLEQRVDPQVG